MRMTFVSVTSGGSGSLGETLNLHPIHEEGPPHYGAKAGNERTALPQV